MAAVNKWTVFARRNGFIEFPPDAHHFSLYITNLSEKNAPYSTFKLLQAAMPFYFAARNSNITVVTKLPFVKLVLSGALRKAAKERGPIRKATTFSEDEVKSFLISVFWPRGSRTYPNPSLKDWRTATRLYTYYFTLCRFDCYSKLRKGSIQFFNDYLILNFPSRKNDQHYSGSQSILKYRNDLLCPSLIYQTYFSIMNFKTDQDVLNCRLSINGKSARAQTNLAYQQALKDSKELTTKFGYQNVTEKSFKSSGVTVLLDKKTPLHDVQIYGGWKSLETPMHYHNTSVLRRKEVSSAL